METSTSRSAIWADQSMTEYTPDWPSQNCGGLSILRRTECDVFEATSRPPVQPCPGILFAPFHRVNGNIDGGGGSMGQGTSSNFWNPGNDGVRITVVDADSGNAISSPIDFTNRSQNNVVHFGKVNKLQYLAGTALTPQSGAGYDYTRPTVYAHHRQQ